MHRERSSTALPKHPAQLRALSSSFGACLLLLSLAGPGHTQPHIAIDDASWRLQSAGDGIFLYSSSVPGIDVVPLKATMIIPGTIEEVSLVLEDIPRRGEWISNLGKSVLLARPNEYDQTEYMRISVPWPAKDRSAVVRAQVTVSDALDQATIAAESVEFPLPDSLPRLVSSKIYASTFEMTQQGDRVNVVALVFVDPQGSIPKWIVNYFSRRVSRATLAALRRQVARKLYSPAQIATMRRRMERYKAFSDGRTSKR